MPLTSLDLTVMIVDDERYFRRFVSELLRSQGVARCVEAKDGAEALGLFPVIKPDLVILDINMPHTDGLGALRGIRALDAEVPVVMLTSIADEAVVEQCVEQGASYFIRKDVPAQEMARELRELVLQEFIDEPPASAP